MHTYNHVLRGDKLFMILAPVCIAIIAAAWTPSFVAFAVRNPLCSSGEHTVSSGHVVRDCWYCVDLMLPLLSLCSRHPYCCKASSSVS